MSLGTLTPAARKNTNREYRGTDVKGMSRFSTWFAPGTAPRNASPSDIDGMLHDNNGNRFLMIELKPVGATVPMGQQYTLTGFSKLPGCSAMVIHDPHSDEYLNHSYKMPRNTVLEVVFYTNGKQTPMTVTVEQLGQLITSWYAKTWG